MVNLLPRIGFIDETSLKTSMAKTTTGRSPRGAPRVTDDPRCRMITSDFFAMAAGDGFAFADERRFRFANSAEGHDQLIATIRNMPGPVKLGFEAAGGHEWEL
ncbi:hypothetical protein [Roseovarius nitratireducens]|uniref:hypothetical protein n=1 Tax=Roseovarius nitratireducens TaxID=2044597 RepID=UPI0019818706|nr:hypothetical protein [Roseovarius nitratireducens]